MKFLAARAAAESFDFAQGKLAANDSGRVSTGSSLVFRTSKTVLRLRLYAALVLVDCAAILGGFAFASTIRFGDPVNQASLELSLLLLPVYLLIALHNRAYSIQVLERPKSGIKRSAMAFLYSAAVLLGFLFFLKSGALFSRLIMGIGITMTFAMLILARWQFGQIVGARFKWRFTNDILFVDAVPVLPTRGEIVVFADQAQLSPNTNDPVLMDRMGRLLNNCDRVVVACPKERRQAWAAMMKGMSVNVEIIAPELDEIGALAMGQISDHSTVLVSHAPIGTRDRILKRALDLFICIPAVLLSLPVLGIIAVAIKLDSKGPILFCQTRVGRSNRVFKIYKFRSMRTDFADKLGSRSTSRDDDRITRVGAFLRSSSLDELPQLLNVLRGDMSIVGPRPHALGSMAEEELFWHIDPRYWERHVIQPGLTGLAQIRGYRGATLQRSDLSNRVQADLEYLTDWSIWRDIGIIISTMKVLFHRNAF